AAQTYLNTGGTAEDVTVAFTPPSALNNRIGVLAVMTPVAAAALFAEATAAPVATNPVSAAIGAADADRDVYAFAWVGGSGVTATNATIGGNTPTVVGGYYETNRAAEFMSYPVATGETVTLSRDGDSSGLLGAFRVSGYAPVATAPVQGARQEANNLSGTGITCTVPIGGCVLIATKNYETVAPDQGALTGTLTSDRNITAVWHNDTGAAQTVAFTASTGTSSGQKYIVGCILEPA
ncbi:MAG: hypothetical protein ACK5LJ_00950, partial [Paracoccus sp. (in: a-proteobacteria)]